MANRPECQRSAPADPGRRLHRSGDAPVPDEKRDSQMVRDRLAGSAVRFASARDVGRELRGHRQRAPGVDRRGGVARVGERGMRRKPMAVSCLEAEMGMCREQAPRAGSISEPEPVGDVSCARAPRHDVEGSVQVGCGARGRFSAPRRAGAERKSRSQHSAEYQGAHYGPWWMALNTMLPRPQTFVAGLTGMVTALVGPVLIRSLNALFSHGPL